MRQLVGLKCALCQKRIESIVEGSFCPACGCPVHKKCTPGAPPGDMCATCGAPVAVAAENQRQERAQAAVLEADVRSSQGLRHVGMGMAWLFGGLGASLFCFGLSAASGSGSFVVATGAIVAGLGQMIYGFVLLMRKGPPSK